MDKPKIRSLEDAIRGLQEIIAFLQETSASFAEARRRPAKAEPSRTKRAAAVDIKQLAESIRSLDRPQLVEVLSKQSATTLRSLTYQLGLRGISKRPKDELVNAIVRHLIDFREEHRRISTFSERQYLEASPRDEDSP